MLIKINLFSVLSYKNNLNIFLKFHNIFWYNPDHQVKNKLLSQTTVKVELWVFL